MILGIQLNGSSIQMGCVTREGDLIHHTMFNTRDWIASRGIMPCLSSEIKKYMHKFPGLKGVGIAISGLLSADRKKVVHSLHIPSLDNTPVATMLQAEFPQIEFKLEQVGNCITLGEHFFGHSHLDNFLLISLDTWVESGAIIGNKLFRGAHGNGMQMDTMLTGFDKALVENLSHRQGVQATLLISSNKTLGQQIGWKQLVAYALDLIDERAYTGILKGKSLTPEEMYKAALQGDSIALSVFTYAGYLLGEALISVIRIMDCTTILLTGATAIAADLLLPSINEKLKVYLPDYYLQSLSIKKAIVGEKAGLLGTLCLFDGQVKPISTSLGYEKLLQLKM